MRSRHGIAGWRHQMETFSALLAICAGNSPVPVEFPAQRPVTRSFDVFFDLHHPNKRLSKQWWGWWFETPSCPLWRHRNGWHKSCHRCVIWDTPSTKLQPRQNSFRKLIRCSETPPEFKGSVKYTLKPQRKKWNLVIHKISRERNTTDRDVSRKHVELMKYLFIVT